MNTGNRILIIGLCAAYAQSASNLAPLDVDPFGHLDEKTPREIYDLIAVVDPQYKQGEYPAAIERYCADLELCMEVNGVDAAAFWLNQGRKPFSAKGSQMIAEMIAEGAFLRKGITYNQKVLQGRNTEPVPASDDEEPLIPSEPVKPPVVESEDPAAKGNEQDSEGAEGQDQDAATAENAEPIKEAIKNLKSNKK